MSNKLDCTCLWDGKWDGKNGRTLSLLCPVHGDPLLTNIVPKEDGLLLRLAHAVYDVNCHWVDSSTEEEFASLYEEWLKEHKALVDEAYEVTVKAVGGTDG